MMCPLIVRCRGVTLFYRAKGLARTLSVSPMSSSTDHVRPIEFHHRRVRRLLAETMDDHCQEWDESTMHQSKQSIEWISTNYKESDAPPNIFQDTWRLWEELVAQCQGSLELTLYDSLLNHWRMQLTEDPSVLSPREMMCLMEDYSSRGILRPTEQTYNLILHALTFKFPRGVPLDMVEWADSVLQAMIQQSDHHLRPSIVTFGTLLQLWLSCSEDDYIHTLSRVQTLEQHRRRLHQQGYANMEHSVVYRSSLINAYAKAGRPFDCQALWDEWWNEYFDSLDDSQELHHSPTIQTGTILLRAWKEHPQKAETLLKQIQQLYEDGHLKDGPNVISYTSVLDAWAKSDHPQGAQHAERIFGDLVQLGADSPNVLSYTSVIGAYGKHGDLTKARSLLEEMIQQGIAPNTATFNALLHSMSHLESTKSEEMLNSMSHLAEAHGWECYPNVASYTTVLQQYAKDQDTDGALRVWRKLVKDRNVVPDTLVMNTMLSVLAKAGHAVQAEKLFRQAVQEFSLTPTVVSYTTLMNGWISRSDASTNSSRLVCHVEGLLEEMVERQIEPSLITYTVLCKCYARCGLGQSAVAVLDKVTSNTIKPTAAFYTQVLHALAKSLQITGSKQVEVVDQAERLIRRMLKDGVSPTQITWSAYLKALSNSDLTDKSIRARQAVNWMKESGLNPNHVVQRQLSLILTQGSRAR